MVAYVILGVCLLAGLWLLAKWFISADPRTLARIVRQAAIVVAVVFVFFLAVTGRLGPAIVVLGVLLPMILRWRAVMNRLRAAKGPSPGNLSTIRTDYLEVALDHDSGRMTGHVLRGRFAGASLEDLTVDQLIELLAESRLADGQSAAIVEAFLDREHGSEWRSMAGADSGGSTAGGTGSGSSGSMTLEEAYSVLGLAPGATPEEIKAAHHRLMKKFHPDQGGSDYLAAKLNQAKDKLLSS